MIMFRHLKVAFACTAIMAVSTSLLQAQITLGSTADPSKGALLELKEQDATGASPTSNKGMVFPRVELSDKDNLYPMFESNGSGEYQIGTVVYTKADEDAKHAGMIVYNVTANATFAPGLHIWNGTSWLRMDNSPVIAPAITDLLCSGWTMQPATYTASQPFEGILKVPYTGGNGGAYAGANIGSIGNGLSMELIAGKLAIGGGEVMYRIHGTPTSGSPTATPVNITFLTKTCTSSMQLGGGVVSKPLSYARKNIILQKPSFACPPWSPSSGRFAQQDSPTTQESEMSFGRLKIRLRYYNVRQPSESDGCYWLMFPEYSLVDGTDHTNAIIYMDKGGEGMGSGAAFACFARKVLESGIWKRMNGGAVNNGNTVNDGDGKGGSFYSTAYSKDDFTIGKRDIALIYVQLQHNDYNQMYRIALNAYETIPAAGTVSAVNGQISIFIELLE